MALFHKFSNIPHSGYRNMMETSRLNHRWSSNKPISCWL